MPLIVVTDDDEQICSWVRSVLEAEGFGVIEAADGRRALLIIEQEAPELVILDVFLLVQDGLETILKLRHGQVPVKILAMSGQPLQGYDILKMAAAFGAHGLLEKPCSAGSLLHAVKALLGSVQHHAA